MTHENSADIAWEQRVQLTFLGANRQVTGSRYFLEAGGLRLIIDCGMFQERKYLDRNWEPFPVDPSTIDAMLLTHAHLDHCGLIPRLVAQGYNKPIYTVEPSVELAKIILADAGHIQEEDARYKAKRHRREKRKGKHPEIPLYDAEDAADVFPLLKPVAYNQSMKLNDRVSVVFKDAGHILGSAFLEITVTNDDGKTERLVFSGDIGQWDKPLLEDPELVHEGDWIVMESTYGDRLHKENGPIEDQIERIVNASVESGGNILIPTFAVERAQELIYYLGVLMRADRIPRLRVYLDSPMAINVTEVFHDHCHYLDDAVRERVKGCAEALGYPELILSKTANQSKAINGLTGTNIILAGSGMCTAGRIKHHLRNNLANEKTTVVFVGYQAAGSLGRLISEGRDEVRIHGKMIPVNAKIERIYGLSAHGDRNDLIRWLGGLSRPPRGVFLTHGDGESADALAHAINEHYGWHVQVPEYKESVTLH